MKKIARLECTFEFTLKSKSDRKFEIWPRGSGFLRIQRTQKITKSLNNWCVIEQLTQLSSQNSRAVTSRIEPLAQIWSDFWKHRPSVPTPSDFQPSARHFCPCTADQLPSSRNFILANFHRQSLLFSTHSDCPIFPAPTLNLSPKRRYFS